MRTSTYAPCARRTAIALFITAARLSGNGGTTMRAPFERVRDRGTACNRCKQFPGVRHAAVAGSFGSKPAITPSTIAASVTFRASGPAVS